MSASKKNIRLVKLFDLTVDQTVELFYQNKTLDFVSEETIRESNINGKTLCCLDHTLIEHCFKITDHEHKKMIKDYLSFHTPTARLGEVF
mgnify:CR=1 FL=1